MCWLWREHDKLNDTERLKDTFKRTEIQILFNLKQPDPVRINEGHLTCVSALHLARRWGNLQLWAESPMQAKSFLHELLTKTMKGTFSLHLCLQHRLEATKGSGHGTKANVFSQTERKLVFPKWIICNINIFLVHTSFSQSLVVTPAYCWQIIPLL